MPPPDHARDMHRRDGRCQARAMFLMLPQDPIAAATALIPSICAPTRCRCCSRRAVREVCRCRARCSGSFADAHAIKFAHLAFNFTPPGTN